MLVRRLAFLIVVLMGLTVIAAALAPRPETTQTERPTGPTGETGAQEPEISPGTAEPVTEPPDVAKATFVERGGDPRRVEAEVGQTVRLTIEVDGPEQVAIEAFDIVAVADAESPVEIEFVPDRPGRFEVKLLDRPALSAVIGLIDVRAATPAAEETPDSVERPDEQEQQPDDGAAEPADTTAG